jgi:hypothetical protein
MGVVEGLRIALLFDSPALFAVPRPEDASWIDASLVQVGQVERALRRLGHAPRRLAYGGDARALVGTLVGDRPDLVLNLTQGRHCGDVARLLDLLGNPPNLEILPLRENDFSGYPAGTPRIMSYAAKWLEGSVEFNSIESHCPIEVEPALRARLEAAATRAFVVTGCRDYARVDFRVDRAGVPRVMEINTNPDLQLDGGFTTSALESGRSYDKIVDDLLGHALRRAPGRPAPVG